METKTRAKQSTRAKVSVHILDTNDNYPMFTQVHYNASVRENAKEGDIVTKVWATDADSGDGGVVYFYLLGSGNKNFAINKMTGEVTVAPGAGLDRETTSKYYLTIEARDNKGTGNRYALPLPNVHELNFNHVQKPQIYSLKKLFCLINTFLIFI